MSSLITLSVSRIQTLATAILEAVDVPRDDAILVARSLIAADRSGIGSHGLLRFPYYVEAIRQGGINPYGDCTWVNENAPVGTLEANRAFGQVAMGRALDKLVPWAKRFGIAAVAVQGSTHYGAGGFWSEQLAEKGMLSLITSTTGPVVTPFGGSAKVFGTNPLTLSAPSNDEFSLRADMASSSGAYGKIMAAKNEGRRIPRDWAVDADGKATDDPERAMAGALLPFGGAKGSAIAAMLEIFAAGLSDANLSIDIKSLWKHPAADMNAGHFVLAIDCEAFAGREATAAKTQRLQTLIRGAREDQPVIAPGDIEQQKFRASETDVAVQQSVIEQVQGLGRELGLPEEKVAIV